MKNTCSFAVSSLFYLLASTFFLIAFSAQKVFASEKLKDKQTIISQHESGDTIWGG